MGIFDDMHRQKIEVTEALTRLAEAQAREHAARAEAEGAFTAEADARLAAAEEVHRHELALVRAGQQQRSTLVVVVMVGIVFLARIFSDTLLEVLRASP